MDVTSKRIPLRGARTGNRDPSLRHEIVRFHASDLWITCALEFRGRWLQRTSPVRGMSARELQRLPRRLVGGARRRSALCASDEPATPAERTGSCGRYYTALDRRLRSAPATRSSSMIL